ncbi:hypothetical protein [Candidatus Caldatribacterium sp.]|uniref:hypothetical protein n=1 Tax=Candidatus Caldatribacterium sp. TaxID=2282143 RepID=UPI003843B589|nr:hypothetical protein [Candidatus Caldatribacterium sp.]
MHPLEAKLQLLEEILALTRQMEERAREGLSDAFLALLAERGQLIERVRKCDEALSNVDVPQEAKEKMLTLLREIALLNERVNIQALSAFAKEQEAFARLREERTLLERVRESLPPPNGAFDAKG